MNETLYRWTFIFHKVVRQQNLGAVVGGRFYFTVFRSLSINLHRFTWPKLCGLIARLHLKVFDRPIPQGWKNCFFLGGGSSRFLGFYSAMLYALAELGYEIVCRLSVRPSVCLWRFRDHIGWNTSKIISRPNIAYKALLLLWLTSTWAIYSATEARPKLGRIVCVCVK